MYYEKNPMFADAGGSKGWDSPILVPDVLTPSQHLDTLRASHLDPERSLMLAVLEEGINDYCNTKPHSEPDLRSNKAKKLHKDTRLWILGAEAYVTFRDCCEALGISPEWLRKGVLESLVTGKLKRRHTVRANKATVAANVD